eukprot:PITA_34927
MIGFSDEKKGYRLLTNGKFIVSRDVILDETESKSAEEIENLLHKLESKGSKRNGKIQSQPTLPNWYELDFPSSEDESSKAQTSEHQLPKWAVQLLKDVKLDEQNKTGTRRAHRSEGNFALIANDFTEPSSYKEAVKHKEWQQAMAEEDQAVIDNNTWKLVDCIANVKPIGCKWVYRIKYNQKG